MTFIKDLWIGKVRGIEVQRDTERKRKREMDGISSQRLPIHPW